MIGLNDLIWKKDKLYRGKKWTGYKVSQDVEKPTMFRIIKEGWVSEDYFNKTRAKDNAMHLATRMLNKSSEGDAPVPPTVS